MTHSVTVRPGDRLWANAPIVRVGGFCPGCGQPLRVGTIAIWWRGLVGCWRCVFAAAARRMFVGAELLRNPDAVSLPADRPGDPVHVVPIDPGRGG